MIQGPVLLHHMNAQSEKVEAPNHMESGVKNHGIITGLSNLPCYLSLPDERGYGLGLEIKLAPHIWIVLVLFI